MDLCEITRDSKKQPNDILLTASPSMHTANLDEYADLTVLVSTWSSRQHYFVVQTDLSVLQGNHEVSVSTLNDRRSVH